MVDVAIAGAGVFGLWAARHALAAGMSVAIVDPLGPGGGASGGVLGALMPHAPDRLDPLKAFQRDALLELGDAIAALEADTGLDTGFRRFGRLAPARTQRFAEEAKARATAAATAWPGRRMALIREWDDTTWADAAATTHGFVWDDFTAQIAPRAYMRALAAAVSPRAETRWGARIVSWRDGAELSTGETIRAGALIVAAGWESFNWLGARLGRPASTLGDGVKGQAAWFSPGIAAQAEPDAPPRPILYDRGAYVVAHSDGSVAVGSSTETDWSEPDRPTPETASFLDVARAICPAIRDRTPTGWWAGVRPRTRSRAPLLGRIPGSEPIWAATGGYKIGLGIAHRAAACVIADLDAQSYGPIAPESFRPDRLLD